MTSTTTSPTPECGGASAGVRVGPAAPGDYERPEDGWVDHVVCPGFDALPDVDPVGGADGEVWTYTGGGSAEEG